MKYLLVLLITNMLCSAELVLPAKGEYSSDVYSECFDGILWYIVQLDTAIAMEPATVNGKEVPCTDKKEN